MTDGSSAAVLVNTWNQARWIRECLESILSQLPPPAEVVVHDDGSDDATPEILRTFGDRIQVLRSERTTSTPPHLRQAAAIHRSFLLTKGDPVFLLDGDDAFRVGKIRAFLQAFQAPARPILVQSPLQWMDDQGKDIPTLVENFRLCDNPRLQVRRRHNVDLFYPTSALAFRRHFLKRALPVDYQHGKPLWPDTVLSLNALATGPITTLADAWGRRRIHPDSDSASRQRSRTHILRQTLQKTAAYNHFAQLHNAPRVHLWRNPGFLLQLAGLLIPGRVRRWRARFKLYNDRELTTKT